MKQDFRKLWKTRHANKQNSARDTIQFCILRALAAKGEDKVAIAKHFIHKSFNPITNQNKLANGSVPFEVLRYQYLVIPKDSSRTIVLGVPVSDLLFDEEIDQYNEIAKAITPASVLRHYTYFFTRQDIFQEYQLVQTAHAALELGAEIPKEQVKGLYFTVCGVKDLGDLEDVEGVLKSMGLKHVVFREPDIGNQKTAIGVYPVAEHRRGLLRNYNLLKFSQES